MSSVHEAWLRALRTRVDPRGALFALREGAPAAAIALWRIGIEERLSAELPASFLDVYRDIDGERPTSLGVFFGLALLPVRDVTCLHEELCGDRTHERASATSNPPMAIRAAWFNERWLPFATDRGGSYLALDYDPGEAGVAGQVITMGTGEHRQSVVASSFDAFLAEQTALIESENFIASPERFGLKDPPLAHFLDRYDANLVARSRRARSTPTLRTELVPNRPMKIDVNAGMWGGPDIRRLERVIVWTKPGEVWEEVVCEGAGGYSRRVGGDVDDVEAAFHRAVENYERQGLSSRGGS